MADKISQSTSHSVKSLKLASYYVSMRRTLLKELIMERAHRHLDKNSFESKDQTLDFIIAASRFKRGLGLGFLCFAILCFYLGHYFDMLFFLYTYNIILFSVFCS
jgi:hypothetical protein